MKCLLVIAHPLENSLCQHLANEVQDHLQGKGYDITVKNLYKEQFSSALTEGERASYYQAAFDQSSVEKDIEQLTSTESLLLVFPTWWFGFPAILKGWFDRVWAPGHAYNHAKDLGAITPLLTELREVKVVTTLGSPWWVDRFIMWRPVRRVLKTALLGACSKNATFQMLSLYKSENLSKQQVDNFVKKIRETF